MVGPFFISLPEYKVGASDADTDHFHHKSSLNCLVHAPIEGLIKWTVED